MTQAFENLESETAKLRSQLTTFPPDSLDFRPAAASWSALQVLEHLMKVEKTFTAAVRQNLGAPGTVTFKDRVGAIAVQIAMRLPTRVKTPGPIAASITPDVPGDLNSVTHEWEAARAEMRQILESLSPDQNRLGLFRHPVAGWMTAEQGLSFLSAHLGHHRYQLSRLKSAYGSRMQTSRKLR